MTAITDRACVALFLASLLWTGCSRDPAAREAAFVAKAKRYPAEKNSRCPI